MLHLLAAAIAAPAPAPAILKPMDLFDLAVATDPQVRPDGGAVAYVRITNDVMTDKGRKSVWIVDARTGAQTPLAQAGAGDMDEPRWSPDGVRLAYTAHPKGEPAGLYVAWPSTGRSARVATLPHDAGHLAWSRDGSRIAFVMQTPAPAETMGATLKAPKGAEWAELLQVTTRTSYRDDGKGHREAGYRHAFVVSADGGAARQVTTGEFDDDAEAEQPYGALKLKGVPTGLVKVPGAFHDMAARSSQSAAKAQAVLAWFARYGGPQP